MKEGEEIIQEVHTALDEGVGSAVSIFVPAVRGANFGAGEHGFDLVDLVQKHLAGKVSAVESLGPDSDTVNSSLVAVNGGLDGTSIGVKGRWNVGPIRWMLNRVKRRIWEDWNGSVDGAVPNAEDDLEAS